MEPFYPAHDWAIRFLNFETAYIPFDDSFSLDLDVLASTLADKKVTGFVLSNPSNPTGSVFSQPQLEDIMEICQGHGVLLVLDEVYRDFIWEGTHVSPLSSFPLENIVVLRSFSKNLALAGWRAGYAVTAADRAKQMKQVHEAFYVGAPAPAQLVLAKLLLDPTAGLEKFMKDLVELYRENRTAVIDIFRDYGMEPVPKEGAYYMMVKHNRSGDMAAMRELLERGIAVAPGTPFFRPGTEDTDYIRIHFALAREAVLTVREILTAE